jgi:hypothetical protein
MGKATAEATAFSVGRNVNMVIVGTILTVTVDLSVDSPLSTSGKNDSIATTGAPADIGMLPDGRPAKMNLSVYAPVPASRIDESVAKQKAVAAAKAAKDAAKA